MSNLEITGRLIEIFDTEQIKETFKKREFVIELIDESPNGMTYTNAASFQLVNNNCESIDRFKVGDDVKVSFNIRGNKWEKDGKVRYITNLNAWRIEPAGAAQQGGYAQPQGGYAQAPGGPPATNMGGVPPQSYGQPNNFPPPPQQPQQQAPGGYNQPAPGQSDDGLPF